MNGVDDLAVIDSLQIDRGNPEARVAELPLDHVERHAFSSHLSSVRMPKLMRHEATTHAGSDRELLRIAAVCRFHTASTCVWRTERAADSAARSTYRAGRARVLSP